MAWAHVMLLRYFPGKNQLDNKGYRRLAPAKFEELHSQARVRASDIYKDLKSQREDLGLGEFDSYIPDAFGRSL